ncbi:hypothetical protein LY78DRAFT_662290 [Colletotrichum sublineola]|nr:hypothetical protein LY78DRAFT_662290 [Colletotrichum sublineola]
MLDWGGKPARQRKRRNARYEDGSAHSVSSASASPPDTASPCLSPRDTAKPLLLSSKPSTFSHCSAEDAARERAALERFAEQALISYMKADPCADHHLKLIQFNTINGLTRNAAALGYQFDWLICAVISPFGSDGQARGSVSAYPVAVPRSLVPTTRQLTTRHHPWIDLFPIPRMRDNLLMATSVLSPEDEQRLFDDIMDSGGGKNEWAGLLVWGEPWDPQSWEVSLPFLKRWGWLLRGCPEIIMSTNRWRCRRGERPISTPGFILEECSQ